MTLRRSSSLTRFFVPVALVDTLDETLTKRIAKKRFRSIESETEEVESIGWVAPSDPTGALFKSADVVRGDHIFLCLRADKKRAPAAWVRIKLQERVRAERDGGPPLGNKRKAELKEEVVRELVERNLPTVRICNLVWSVQRGQIFLFSTSPSMIEAFAGLFVHTFGGDPPEPITAGTLIQRSRLDGNARAAWHEMQALELAP